MYVVTVSVCNFDENLLVSTVTDGDWLSISSFSTTNLVIVCLDHFTR